MCNCFGSCAICAPVREFVLVPAEEIKENNMLKIKKGDKVKATAKEGSDVVTFTALDAGRTYAETDKWFLYTDEWDFEVIERPYELPTEPGLYAMMGLCTADNVKLQYQRIMRFYDGEWVELTGGNADKDTLMRLKPVLSKLKATEV